MSSGPRGVCKRCAQSIWSREGDDPRDDELLVARADAAGSAGALSDCVCRHHCAYPERLCGDPLTPDALCVRGGVGRLRSLLAGSVAVVLGVRQASDYGVAIARELAQALAARGATVAGMLSDGSGASALEAALRARGRAVAMLAEDARRCSPVSGGVLYNRIVERGCAVSLPTDGGQMPNGERRAVLTTQTLALLADVVIVVEAGADEHGLAIAEVCRSRGTALAAVPGRIDSPSSRGTNALIVAGAIAVGDVGEAVGLLDDSRKRAGGRARSRRSTPVSRPSRAEGRRAAQGLRRRSRQPTPASEHVPTTQAPGAAGELDVQLAQILERVQLGEDTLDALRAGGGDTSALELTLAELELLGLLRRGIGGRYLPIGEAGSARRLRGCVSSDRHSRLPGARAFGERR